MTATAAEFKSLFPQWAGTADSAIEAWFVQFPLRFTAARFGSQATMGMYLFTGHMLTSFNPDAASNAEDSTLRGPVTSEKVGDLARSYASAVDLTRVSSSLMWLATSTYGLALIGVIQSRSSARGRVILTGSSA